MNVMILLNYNDYHTTMNYLSKIKGFHSLDKIVVVDNCSTDNSYAVLCNYESEKIHVIKTLHNDGYASGNNYGIEYALSTFQNIDNFIISNPDIEVDDDTICLLSKIKDEDSSTFAITPFVLDACGHKTRRFAWKKMTYGYILLSCTCLIQALFRRILGYSKFYEKLETDDKNRMQVDILPGCFFLVDSKKWSEIGGFDEGTFLYFEEDILFSKAINRGYHNYVACSLELRHMEGVSINNSIKKFKSREKIFMDSCIYYMKNYMNCSMLKINIYKWMNKFFLFERYVYFKMFIRK